MRRQIPGLHSWRPDGQDRLEGRFLVRVDPAFSCWQPGKPFLERPFVIFEPEALKKKPFVARLYFTDKALWKFNWFLRDFGYDAELLRQDQVDVKALLGLQCIVQTCHAFINERTYQNMDGFAPAGDWEALSSIGKDAREAKGKAHGF